MTQFHVKAFSQEYIYIILYKENIATRYMHNVTFCS